MYRPPTRSERIEAFIDHFLKSGQYRSTTISLYPGEIRDIEKGKYAEGLGVSQGSYDSRNSSQIVCTIYKLT